MADIETSADMVEVQSSRLVGQMIQIHHCPVELKTLAELRHSSIVVVCHVDGPRALVDRHVTRDVEVLDVRTTTPAETAKNVTVSVDEAHAMKTGRRQTVDDDELDVDVTWPQLDRVPRQFYVRLEADLSNYVPRAVQHDQFPCPDASHKEVSLRLRDPQSSGVIGDRPLAV